MKGLLARWDVTPAEQAEMTFEQVLTIINLRRVEIACLLGLFTRLIEFGGGLRTASTVAQMIMLPAFLLAAIPIRRSGNMPLARGFIAVILIVALLASQWSVAALGASGRLTSGYLTMLLSLALLFVVPPRMVASALTALFATYGLIVGNTPAQLGEKITAIENAAIVSVIAVVASALIYGGRRRDYEQKREIRRQNERLLDRNTELDALMAITAHDIRSPLYGLRNLLDLAARRAPQEPDLPLVVLRQARASIDAMLALATRLLDAHMAEHRPLTRLVDDDVRRHVLGAAARIGPLAQSAEVRIHTDLPDRPLIATFDSDALAQILDNLLSNGVRFSPRGGVLTVVAVHDEARASIAIVDQGPGVDPAHRDLLFRKFHRGAGGCMDDLPSTGMGLFIVATLAARMGAAVRYDPVREGGSAFVVTLPESGSRQAA